MKWYVEEGIIVGKSELETIYPNANEIFGAGKHIIFGKQKYDFQIDGLKFSKLLPLKVGIKFDLINDKIVAKMICGIFLIIILELLRIFCLKIKSQLTLL